MRTVNKTEIKKFNKLAAEWWDPEGSFKPLHKFNPIRNNIHTINEKEFGSKNIEEIPTDIVINKMNNLLS